MIGLIQRVTHASVTVDNKVVGEIGPGLLALIGIEKEDTDTTMQKLVDKMLAYRVFADRQDKMNLSLTQTSGGLLLVPQFTLVADTGHGLRPGFSNGASPADARLKFDDLVAYASSTYGQIASGRFGADMQVSLTNDGPVTFWLQS